MAIVTLDATKFKKQYPEFSGLSDDVCARLFDVACIYLNNTDRSPIRNAAKRETLLFMLMAHVQSLSANATGSASGGSAAGGSGMVGRVSSATEGSVSISADYGPTSGSAAWFLQTQYGAMYWQAISSLRMFRYIVPKTVCGNGC